MILDATQAAAFTNTCGAVPEAAAPRHSRLISLNVLSLADQASLWKIPLLQACCECIENKYIFSSSTQPWTLFNIDQRGRMKGRNVLQVKPVMWELKWKPPFLTPCSLSSLFDHRGKPVLPHVPVCLQKFFQSCLFFDPSCYRESIKSIFLWNATWCLYRKNIISYWQGCSHLWVFLPPSSSESAALVRPDLTFQ